MRFHASSLAVGVLVLAAACGNGNGGKLTADPTPTPSTAPTPGGLTAEQLAGTYDSDRGLAIVTGQDPQLHIDLGLLREAFESFGGTIRDDGTLEVAGIETQQDTGQVAITGHLHVEQTSAESRISGTLVTVDRGEFSFAAVRPVAGTSSRFSGSYIVLFGAALNGTGVASRAVITIDVPTSGTGRSLAAADETDDNGARLGTLDTGDCVVSPLGNVQCRLPYHGAGTQGPFGGPSVFDAFLTGQLLIGPLGVPEGQGTVTVTNQAPITSHAFPFTTWSAIVQPPG
jgi:hypothetical protein